MHLTGKQLDRKQNKIKLLLDELITVINKRESFFYKITNFWKKKKQYNIYLYGAVGRGKTMLMHYFYDRIICSKSMVHFQQFMKELHTRLHEIEQKGVSLDLLVDSFASEISDESKVLCIDEFEIHDIADAMMVMSLFRCLYKREVIIFVTTNTPPKNLYKDGLQRESFIPFIKEIYKNFSVLNLDTNYDYRYLKTTLDKRIFLPRNKKSKEIISSIKNGLIEVDSAKPAVINIFGRNLLFNSSSGKAIFTDFKELFERDLGYADYSQITIEYKIFIVENIRKIKDSETDIILRFINFIDNAYYNRVLLYLEGACKAEEIYTKGIKIDEFQRTLSRIHEMNAVEYINEDKL